jgi:acyl-CoA synthetase (NDP forming)
MQSLFSRRSTLSRIADNQQQYGIGVPKGEVARSAEEAEAVARSIGISSPCLYSPLLCARH